MKLSVTPYTEAERLSAVRRYDILDTPADGSFDRITAMAATLLSTPIAIISLVDTDRIWFKSHHGLDVTQIDREPGLCASAILQDDAYLVQDTISDPRTLANPLVASDFGLRFYLAVPLQTHDGFNLGTLCVLDFTARTVTQEQIDLLTGLAGLVMDQMELRLSSRSAIAEVSTALGRAEMMGKEIDHRVMNSLQFIAGMLDLQGRGASHPDTAAQLEIAAQRVATVARVHRHFYLDAAVETTCPLEYAKRLVADLASVLAPTKVTVDGAPGQIATTLVMPLGLILNELATNAAKHGAKRIAIDVRPEGKGVAIMVSDDGPGLPADFDPASRKGLGMRVIHSLVQKHGGRLDFGNQAQGGSRFVVAIA